MMRRPFSLLLAAVLLASSPFLEAAQRLKDLATIQGVRSNQLIGYGIVVGLDGKGDDSTQFTQQSIASMMKQLGVQLPPNFNPNLKNAAAVSLTATLPPFAQPGQLLDVTVSSLNNAKSLKGGTLLLSPLKGADGQVYAIAQGNLIIAGAGEEKGGNKSQTNQLTAGRIPGGATVERAVPTSLGQGEFIFLGLKETDFTTASRVAQVINLTYGAGTARALDGRQVQVRAPQEPDARVRFLGSLESLAVSPGEDSAKIILNARTGSIVMNRHVTLEDCAVAHGNLTVTVKSTPQVSQPNALSGGTTTTTQKTDISIQADKGRLLTLPRSASLSDVVRALNAVGATPQDLLAILQALKSSGALKAELEII